jgi:hypothetical protein
MKRQKKEKVIHISHRNFDKINFWDIDEEGNAEITFWKSDMEYKFAELGMHFENKYVEFLKQIGITDEVIYEMYQMGEYEDNSWWEFGDFKEECIFYFVFVLPETLEDDEYAPSPESIHHKDQYKIF